MHYSKIHENWDGLSHNFETTLSLSLTQSPSHSVSHSVSLSLSLSLGHSLTHSAVQTLLFNFPFFHAKHFFSSHTLSHSQRRFPKKFFPPTDLTRPLCQTCHKYFLTCAYATADAPYFSSLVCRGAHRRARRFGNLCRLTFMCGRARVVCAF